MAIVSVGRPFPDRPCGPSQEGNHNFMVWCRNHPSPRSRPSWLVIYGRKLWLFNLRAKFLVSHRIRVGGGLDWFVRNRSSAATRTFLPSLAIRPVSTTWCSGMKFSRVLTSEAFVFVSSALLALCLFVADGDGERQILKRIPGFTFGFSFFALGRDTKVLFVFVISCVGFFLRRMGCMCLLS